MTLRLSTEYQIFTHIIKFLNLWFDLFSVAKAHQHILNLQRDNQELVKKINSTPLIPAGASPDEAYAIQLQARDNEIQRLQRELKEAHDDRDDIIEQLKQQGITEIKAKTQLFQTRNSLFFLNL